MNEKKDNKSREKWADKSKTMKGKKEANDNAFASTGEVSYMPIKNLRNLQRSQQPTVERSTPTVPGPCKWQHQPMAWNRK
jgi:hypothetical protein